MSTSAERKPARQTPRKVFGTAQENYEYHSQTLETVKHDLRPDSRP
jgi:hypothetical protein